MAVSNLQLYLFVNGRVVKNTKDLEPLFKSLSVSADGSNNGLDVTELAGKFHFNSKILGGIANGAAAGQALSYSQRGASGGVASLDGGGKIPATQLPSSVMTYEGTFDASGTPASPLLNGDVAADAGMVYLTSVAGSFNFGAGAISFAVGDWAVYNGTIWEKSTNSNAVVSVNGFTGVVTLTTSNIAEGSNLYYTTARFDTAFSGKTSTDLAEGTNLYYTQARFDSALAAKSTSNLAEGSNLYFTNARAIAATLTSYAAAAGTVTSADSILSALQKIDGNSSGSNVRSFTNAEGGSVAHTIRQVVYEDSFGNMKKALASNSALNRGTTFAMVKNASIADTASGDYYLPGKGSIVPGFSGLTANTPVYLSRAAAGGFIQSLTGFVAGESVVYLGTAISATELEFDPEYDFVYG